MLLASFFPPCRRDAIEVLRTALHRAAKGQRHRTIAKQPDRPQPSTVRNWLRRARGLAEELHDVGVSKLAAIDPTFGPIVLRATPLPVLWRSSDSWPLPSFVGSVSPGNHRGA